jgi:hypothetical protein
VTDSRGGEQPEPPGQVRDPVFLLAPARSYSTVSLAMLAGHPQLYGFPEMLLFTAPTVGEILSGAGRRSNADWVNFGNTGISRAVAQILEGSQSAAAVERAVDWLQAHSDWESVALMNHLLRLVHPKTGLETSPDTVHSERALKACLGAYPRSTYLHLTRHPVGTVQSMRKHWARFFPPEMSRQMRNTVCLMSWYTCHLRIVKALLDLPGDQWMRVRAEDLLREPRIWLPRVLDRLSLSHDNITIEQMMQTDKWRFAQYNPGAAGGGDYSFLRHPALRPVPPPPTELDSPSWDITDELRRRITVLARYLGY